MKHIVRDTFFFFAGSLLVAGITSVALAKTISPMERSPEGTISESAPMPTIIGGGKDAHGCFVSAGYSWCESKQKCLRPWMETCPKTETYSRSTWTCMNNIAGSSLACEPLSVTRKKAEDACRNQCLTLCRPTSGMIGTDMSTCTQQCGVQTVRQGTLCTGTTPQPVCGNGICEKSEKALCPTCKPGEACACTPCPEDCTTPPPTPMPICGNGICEKGEDQVICPVCFRAPCNVPCTVSCGGDCPTTATKPATITSPTKSSPAR